MNHGSTADLDRLRAAIAARPARISRLSLEGRIQAAVCVPLHEGPRGLEVWAIKRVESVYAAYRVLPGHAKVEN